MDKPGVEDTDGMGWIPRGVNWMERDGIEWAKLFQLERTNNDHLVPLWEGLWFIFLHTSETK